MAGLNRTLEPEQMMLFSNDRPDLAVCNKNGHYNVITDVRTAVRSLAGICPDAAATPGHAALLSEIEKDAKWMQQAAAQGLTFHALVSEDGGRLGDGTLRFVNFLATHARRRHATLCQLSGHPCRFLDGGATGLRVFRPAALTLRHRQGGLRTHQ